MSAAGFWKKKFDLCNRKRINKPKIDDIMLDLIKFFITSNVSASAIQNKYLSKLLDRVLDVPTAKTFRETQLRACYDLLRVEIEFKLKNADTVCLIVDIWTTGTNKDFIALVAVLTDFYFRREFVIVDMMRMPGNSHNAENCRDAIQNMVFSTNYCYLIYSFSFSNNQVNSYEFKKLNISSIVTDGGSNFVRLFKQLQKQLEGTEKCRSM